MFWTMMAALAADPGKIEGTWAYSGGPEQLAARDAMVEETVSTFNFAFRGFARGKLLKVAALDDSISIQGDDAQVTFVYTGVNGRTSSGASTGVADDLRGSNVSFTVVPDKSIVIYGATSDGSKRSTYELVDANTMRASYVVESGRLDGPLTWTFTYTRK